MCHTWIIELNINSILIIIQLNQALNNLLIKMHKMNEFIINNYFMVRGEHSVHSVLLKFYFVTILFMLSMCPMFIYLRRFIPSSKCFHSGVLRQQSCIKYQRRHFEYYYLHFLYNILSWSILFVWKQDELIIPTWIDLSDLLWCKKIALLRNNFDQKRSIRLKIE